MKQQITPEQERAMCRMVPKIAATLSKIPRNNSLDDVRAQREEAVEAMRNIAEGASKEQRNLTEREQQCFDGLDALQANLKADIEQRELNGAFEAGSGITRMGLNTHQAGWVDRNGQPVEVVAKGQKFSRGDSGPTLGALMRGMVVPGRPEIRNALSELTDSAGGYTVPDHVLRKFIDAMRARMVVEQAGAQTVLLNTEQTTIARVATDPVPGWRAENAAVTESDPTFEAVTFNAKSLAVLIKVSRELVEDSVNAEDILMTVLAKSLAQELDRVALFGSGSGSEPTGLINTSNIQSVSMGTNGAAITDYSEILSLLEDLAVANANTPTAMIMAPRTYYTLAGLIAGDNQPLRAPDVVAGIPKLISSVVPIDDTQGTASNASRILSGDFTQLWIGMRSSLRIEVLKERYADNLQYGFLAHMRADVAAAQPPALGELIGIIP